MHMKNKVAIVTGGGGGIGAASCKALAHEGVSVAVVDINLEKARKVAEAITSEGASALAIEVDVTSQKSVYSTVQRVVDHFGKIDFLINAAGLAGGASFLEHTGEMLDEVLASHLKSMMFASQAVLPKMMEQRYGRIVNITSRAGWRGRPGTAAYGAAKAAMTGMSRVMAAEFGEYGVTVNNVAPGMVLSPMTQDLY